jgi:hypothetical protein
LVSGGLYCGSTAEFAKPSFETVPIHRHFFPTSYCGILRFYCGIPDGRLMGSANELASHYNRGMSKPFERGIHENAGHLVAVRL